MALAVHDEGLFIRGCRRRLQRGGEASGTRIGLPRATANGWLSVRRVRMGIVVASILAFWAGEFVNSYVLARMKLWTGGRMLWTRTIGSTVVGQGVDSIIFYPIAFYGIWSTEQVLTVMVTNWALKVLWEAALTPVTYVVVGTLKRREGIELFDEDTNFSPFHAKV